MYPRPDERHALFDLYDSTWPGLAVRIREAERLGWPWHDVTMPFVAWDGEVAVAHVGVICLPVILDGHNTALAGIHAVCTRPSHRGRGLCRQLMQQALAHIDAHYETTFLTTGHGTLYEPFGFRRVPECRACVPAPTRRQGQPVRALTDSPEDLHTLRRLLVSAAPTSSRLGMRESGWALIINEVLGTGGLKRLFYAESLDAMVAIQQKHKDRRLVLLDLAAPALPTLDALLACIPGDWNEVELAFPADRLAPDAKPLAYDNDDDRLLIRGPWPLKAPATTLPPLRRC